jgi:hypothetical protein
VIPSLGSRRASLPPRAQGIVLDPPDRRVLTHYKAALAGAGSTETIRSASEMPYPVRSEPACAISWRWCARLRADDSPACQQEGGDTVRARESLVRRGEGATNRHAHRAKDIHAGANLRTEAMMVDRTIGAAHKFTPSRALRLWRSGCTAGPMPAHDFTTY